MAGRAHLDTEAVIAYLEASSVQLDWLRRRFVLLATGTGNYEYPADSWRIADVLGAKGIPNRVDAWSAEWHHDWPTWRRMLPQYLDEFIA